MDVTIERIGATGRAFRIRHSAGSFDIRTRSPRRFLVIDVIGQSVFKRTDNLKTAIAARNQNARRIALDTWTANAV